MVLPLYEFFLIRFVRTKNYSVWESPEELAVTTITPNLSTKDSYQSIIEQESIAIEQGTQAARIWESPESPEHLIPKLRLRYHLIGFFLE